MNRTVSPLHRGPGVKAGVHISVKGSSNTGIKSSLSKPTLSTIQVAVYVQVLIDFYFFFGFAPKSQVDTHLLIYTFLEPSHVLPY